MGEKEMNWIGRLASIAERCRKEGWDSYGAAPVTDAALASAEVVCRSLDVVPGVNGDIEVTMLAEAIQVTIGPSGVVTGVFVDTADANSTLGAYATRRDRG